MRFTLITVTLAALTCREALYYPISLQLRGTTIVNLLLLVSIHLKFFITHYSKDPELLLQQNCLERKLYFQAGNSGSHESCTLVH